MQASATHSLPLSDCATAPRLLDRVRNKIRLKHYSLRTEQAYTGWIKRFILHHGKRQPCPMRNEPERSSYFQAGMSLKQTNRG